MMNVTRHSDFVLPGQPIPEFSCTKGHKWDGGDGVDRLRIGLNGDFCLRCFLELIERHCGRIEVKDSGKRMQARLRPEFGPDLDPAKLKRLDGVQPGRRDENSEPPGTGVE